jgi:hypothetical protein
MEYEKYFEDTSKAIGEHFFQKKKLHSINTEGYEDIGVE